MKSKGMSRVHRWTHGKRGQARSRKSAVAVFFKRRRNRTYRRVAKVLLRRGQEERIERRPQRILYDIL